MNFIITIYRNCYQYVRLQLSFLLVYIFIVTFSSCTKNIPQPIKQYNTQKAIFIGNEGNYTYGNASLSFFDPQTNTVENQAFYNANGFPLGDVLQSMIIQDTLGFLAMSNSGKIIVIDTRTIKYITTITNLQSPRYIIFINTQKAYISDLYNKSIAILNLTNYQIINYINIGGSIEQMALLHDFAYAISWSFQNKVYKIDTRTDTVIDSLTVVKQPNSMVIDKHNKLWILSDGGYAGIQGGQEYAALTCIDLDNFSIQKTFTFTDLSSSPTRLTINGTKDTLWFINGNWTANQISSSGIYNLPINATQLPTHAFIPENERLFYGLGVDPQTSIIYVADAVNHIQQGWTLRYTPQGMPLDSFRVDILPAFFCFIP